MFISPEQFHLKYNIQYTYIINKFVIMYTLVYYSIQYLYYDNLKNFEDWSEKNIRYYRSHEIGCCFYNKISLKENSNLFEI